MVPVTSPPELLRTAVLLVLLPPNTCPHASVGPGVRVALRILQDQLGDSIRVLTIDEGSHPAVVRSFGLAELPACVLVRQGVELWRQQGLPEEDGLVSVLLRKISPE